MLLFIQGDDDIMGVYKAKSEKTKDGRVWFLESDIKI